jgi:hypothetical protein
MTTTCDWTPPEQLESLLAKAIAQVRTGEVAPEVLAKTIMVAIQTEVARTKEGLLLRMATALRGPTSS